ncbi:MAG: aminoacyl-histidine dipeptidase [Tannerella sp.]|jgi:dipeptidase D|nr:aminoacyl-histidine dipeptidase [Tannerella sp.]
MATEIKTLNPQSVWGYFYELTQIPRPTGQMEAVTQFIVDFGNNLGLETKQDAVGNVIIRKPATPGFEDRKIVTLQAHLDMVPQKNSDVSHDFLKDSVNAYIDGDWVKARGTTLGADNGIGVAMAMSALADNTLRHGPLEALFTVDEEVGMDGANGLKPGFVRGRILLNCDSEEEGKLFAGCAGGADLNVSFQYRKGAPLIEGDVAVSLFLSGLKGGHSGVDIHLGRANANKLMFRFLKEAVRDYGARLAFVSGGSLRNAIPRETKAVITLPRDNAETLWELVADYQDLYRIEYAGIEDNINFTAEMADTPSTLIPEEIQDDLINSMEACQNGVITMLHDFPGIVESSSNLAVVESSEGLIEIKILARSSSESRKAALLSSLESVFSLAGAKTEYGGAYNGWQPDANSPILKVMGKVYEDMYGKKPEVTVMHAGLECGIIQGVYPDMDMVSFGPDLKHPHSPDEAVSIPSVSRVWEYLKSTLENIPVQ